jgi:hypothetical protein
VDESAESVCSADARRSGRLEAGGRSWLRQGKREAAVRTMGVVVLDVGAQDALELAAARYQEPVEALPAYRADEAFGVRVRLRRPDRRPDDLDPFAADDVVERGV